jgi:hypothetical protein
MSEYIVLSTKVDKEFAEKVQKYCEGNGFTPSSLIRALLEEEINGKKPITDIYDDIEGWLYAILWRNLEILEFLIHSSLVNAYWIKTQTLVFYKGLIPADQLQNLKKLDAYIEHLESDLETIRKEKEALKPLLDKKKKETEKEKTSHV